MFYFERTTYKHVDVVSSSLTQLTLKNVQTAENLAETKTNNIGRQTVLVVN